MSAAMKQGKGATNGGTGGRRRKERWAPQRSVAERRAWNGDGAAKKAGNGNGWAPRGNGGRRLKEMVRDASNGKMRHEERLGRAGRKTWNCEETGGRRREERWETMPQRAMMAWNAGTNRNAEERLRGEQERRHNERGGTPTQGTENARTQGTRNSVGMNGNGEEMVED